MIVLASVLIAVLSVALMTFGWAAIRLSLVLDGHLTAIEMHLRPVDLPSVEDLRVRLDAAERAIDDLPRTWEKERRDAQSAESRARHHAQRALDELEARGLTSPGLEAVADELFANDVEPSDGEAVQPLPEVVAVVPEPDDWLQQTMRKRYGAHG